jgi:D-sedoheptulose 7-phosphate isomerase
VEVRIILKRLEKYFEDSITSKSKFFVAQSEKVLESAKKIKGTFSKGKKVMICGNGGSAADAQHLAAELVGRFEKERKGYPAISLTTDTSILTAWTNDYSFDTVFSRQVEALGKRGDTLVAISTSGNSKNIVNAVIKAKEAGIYTIGILGKGGGVLRDMVDLPVIVSSKRTAHIQECHAMVYHFWCEYIDDDG